MTERDGLCFGFGGFIPDPLLLPFLLYFDPFAATFPVSRIPFPESARSARPPPLLSQCLLEALDVHRMPMLGSDHLREIERKPVRIVELERVLTRDHGLVTEFLHPLQSTFDRLQEALLLGPRDPLNVLLLRHQLRIHVAHHATDRARQLGQGRLAPAQQPGVAHGAPQDAPQHVAAAFVRRIDAIGEQKGDGARVVGEHAIRRAGGAAVVGAPHDLDGLRDDRVK